MAGVLLPSKPHRAHLRAARDTPVSRPGQGFVMNRNRLAALAMALMVTAGAGAASALPPLSQHSEINEGLLAIGIADEVRKRCDRIAPRYVAAFNYLRSLQRKAGDLGYSDAEIDNYVNSDAEKAKMRARGEAVLAAAGVRKDTPDTYCTYGLAEIKKGSLIGSFLRAK